MVEIFSCSFFLSLMHERAISFLTCITPEINYIRQPPSNRQSLLAYAYDKLLLAITRTSGFNFKMVTY